MHVRRLLPHAACLITGLVIGISVDRIQSHEQEGAGSSMPSTPTCSPTIVASPRGAQDAPRLLADIRIAIREEVRAELAAHGSQMNAPQEEGHRPPSKVLDEKTAERQSVAYDKANQSLRKAIGYGAWTQEDRQQLRSMLHELSIPQQDQLIGELFGAIQSGRLRLQDSGPPL